MLLPVPEIHVLWWTDTRSIDQTWEVVEEVTKVWTVSAP